MDDNYYLTFMALFPQDVAQQIFVKKHGQKPQRVFVDKRLLKVGPEPRPKVDTAQAMREADAREMW
jgi:hypothetical protein